MKKILSFFKTASKAFLACFKPPRNVSTITVLQAGGRMSCASSMAWMCLHKTDVTWQINVGHRSQQGEYHLMAMFVWFINASLNKCISNAVFYKNNLPCTLWCKHKCSVHLFPFRFYSIQNTISHLNLGKKLTEAAAGVHLEAFRQL